MPRLDVIRRFKPFAVLAVVLNYSCHSSHITRSNPELALMNEMIAQYRILCSFFITSSFQFMYEQDMSNCASVRAALSLTILMSTCIRTSRAHRTHKPSTNSSPMEFPPMVTIVRGRLHLEQSRCILNTFRSMSSPPSRNKFPVRVNPYKIQDVSDALGIAGIKQKMKRAMLVFWDI